MPKHLLYEDIGGMVFQPEVSLFSKSADRIQISTTTEIIILGQFCNYISGVIVTPRTSGSASAIITSKLYDKLVVDLTVNATPDIYDLSFIDGSGQVIELNGGIESLNINVITPLVVGNSPELWVKSSNLQNSSVLTDGGFEASNDTGNGWNEHAYFGSFNPSSRIDFFLTIDRLIAASTAYCFWRFDTSNTPSTSGNPRLYFSNGNILTVYNSQNSGTNLGAILEGDEIQVSITSSLLEVFKNGLSIFTHSGSYVIANIYSTFTGYRVFKASNIRVEFD